MVNVSNNPFTLIDLELPANSYMIASTNIQNFEEGENCASTISVEQTLVSDMKLFGYYMILFGYNMIFFCSGFNFQEISVMIVALLINFGVKNQVPQFSFEVTAGDLMTVIFYEFAYIIFYGYMDILEIISYFMIDPFTLIDLELPANSYMIACTNTQSFEEGENCASTILVENLDLLHTIRSDMNLFISDMILFGSSFKFQELPIMLVAVLINFGVKNQVPQVSFNIVAGDLMSVISYEFVDIIFCGYLDILEEISGFRSDPFTILIFSIQQNHTCDTSPFQ